jgi:predicted alpha/beta superfamily hydrolase
LYLLDGQAVFDKCTSPPNEEFGADEALTKLIGAGEIEPIIAVAVDEGGSTTQRTKEYIPYPDAAIAIGEGGTFVPDVMGDRFPEFMESEVFPAIAAKYRVLQGRENTAIQGASYGGIAALYALVHRPDLFGSGIVQSPSLQVGNGQFLRDTVWLVAGPTRVALDTGSGNDIPVKLVQQLAENLKAIPASQHLKAPEVLFTIGQGQNHEVPAFASRLPAALLFLYDMHAK